MQEEANLASIEEIVKQQIATLESQIGDHKEQQKNKMQNPNEAAAVSERYDKDVQALLQTSDLLIKLTNLSVNENHDTQQQSEELASVRLESNQIGLS